MRPGDADERVAKRHDDESHQQDSFVVRLNRVPPQDWDEQVVGDQCALHDTHKFSPLPASSRHRARPTGSSDETVGHEKGERYDGQAAVAHEVGTELQFLEQEGD